MRIDRQLGAMAAYGFVSGLPLPLSGFTFRLWLSDSGAGLAVVGLTAWIGLAYSLKFLWAPLLDQTPPVPALRRFGRRRGWLLLVQPALGVAAITAGVVRSGYDADRRLRGGGVVSRFCPPRRTSPSTPGGSRFFRRCDRGSRLPSMSGATGWRCWSPRQGRSRRRRRSAGIWRCLGLRSWWLPAAWSRWWLGERNQVHRCRRWGCDTRLSTLCVRFWFGLRRC